MRPSIPGRTIFPFLGLLAGMLIWLVFLAVKEQSRLLDVELRRKGTITAKNLASDSWQKLYDGDTEALQRITLSLQKSDDDITGAAIVTATGEVLAGSEMQIVLPMNIIDLLDTRGALDYPVEDNHIFIEPLFDKKRTPLGVAVVQVSKIRFSLASKKSTRQISMLILGIFAVLSVLLSLLIFRIYALADAESAKAKNLVKLEHQLLQTEKIAAVGRLASGVAHDFNNMLTAIRGYSLFLYQSLDEGDKRRDDVVEIQRVVTQAASLTRQLLAFSRKQVYQPRVLDLGQVLANLQSLMRRLIGEHIKLNIDVGSEALLVAADPLQIELIVINLAVNARDAMPKGGVLTVRLRAGGPKESLRGKNGTASLDSVVLTIKDTGLGMDPELQERIFDPFFTTKVTGKGTGLGLSIVYKQIEELSGKISLKSAREKGTCWSIFFPRAVGPPAKTAALTAEAPVLRGNETVLLVEDEEAVRQVTRRVLVEYGYSVLAAADGDRAIELAKKHKGPIHIIVTDVVLPKKKDGQEVARLFSSLYPGSKVLYISGYIGEFEIESFKNRPGMAFLGKPFTPEALAGTIRGLLDGKERAAEKNGGNTNG